MPPRYRAIVELPTGDAGERLVEYWKKLIDPDRTTRKEFFESYKVPTKRVLMLTGARALVQYKEWPNQAAIRETIECQWKAGEGGKVLVGKPRQDGITTEECIEFWERFLRGGGGTWNLFSYDTDATKEAFRNFKAFRRQTPPWVFECLLHGGGARWRKSSSMQFELDFPDGTSSLLQCLTAGDKASGSGSAPRGIGFDEFSKWKPEVKADPTSMSEGWDDVPGNLWIIPSTGQGNEAFAKQFMDVYEAQQAGQRHDSGFVACFFSWLGHPQRRIEFDDAKARRAFVATIGKISKWGPQDELNLVAAGAVAEELLWRRKKLAGPAFKGDLALFRREYPLRPSDMFESSALSIFHQQIEIIRSHQVPAMRRERVAREGVFEYAGDGAKVEFHETQFGGWTLFEEPEKQEDGNWYCWGADSASGKQAKDKVSTDGKSDYAVAHVDHGPSSRTCARFRGRVEPEVLAEEVWLACIYFGMPYGLPENNNHGAVFITRFNDKVFKDFTGRDLILYQWLAPGSSIAGEKNTDQGYYTERKSKEVLIADARENFTEIGVYDQGRGTPFDSVYIEEALVYQRNPKTGSAEAARGFDDAISSKMLTLRARQYVIARGLVPLVSKWKPAKAMDPLDAWYHGVAVQHAAQNKGRSQYLGSAFLWLFAATLALV